MQTCYIWIDPVTYNVEYTICVSLCTFCRSVQRIPFKQFGVCGTSKDHFN